MVRYLIIDIYSFNYIRLEQLFPDCSGGRGIEVAVFDRRSLFESSDGLGVGRRRNERSSLISVFGGDVSCDGTTLIDDKTVVVLDRSSSISQIGMNR